MSIKVAVCGPNLRDQSRGQFHIHAVGCADLNRTRREPEYEHAWTVEVNTRKDIVLAIYEPEDFEYDADSEWQNFDDMFVFPCVKGLVDENSVRT